VPWLKLGVLGFFGFAVLKGSAMLTGSSGYSGAQYASIDDYTNNLTKGIVDDQGSLAVSNSMAPATTAELRDADNRLYIKQFAHIAVDEMHRTTIPASVSMAQALIESRAGKGRLARTIHNHFGIKCFSTKCKRGHCRNFEDDSHKDFFREFDTPEQSWAAHSAFLQGKHYQSLYKNGKDYKKWSQGLEEKGYATADTYSETLISIIDKYKLYELDFQ
jgi:flagellum-specific peptidoglycan hydrolase FlgJ